MDHNNNSIGPGRRTESAPGDLSYLETEDGIGAIPVHQPGEDGLSLFENQLLVPPSMVLRSQPVDSNLEMTLGEYAAPGANEPLGPEPAANEPALATSSLPSVKPVSMIPEDFPLFDEFARASSGASVVEPDSVAWENGRTYHGYKEGKYHLPNDAKEQDRLDVQHAGMTLLLGGQLAVAPFEKVPENVLDVATGTGIWALEYDLSAIQPDPDVPNCTFIKDDAEDPWEFGRIRFDYVHLRFVVTCFNDHHGVLNQAFENLKPGGWIEYQDTAPVLMSPHPDWQGEKAKKSQSPLTAGFRFPAGRLLINHAGSAFKEWSDRFIEGARLLGRDLHVPNHYKDWLTEAGFVDVTETKFMIPYGPWHRNERLNNAGSFFLDSAMNGLRGTGWKFLGETGLSGDEIERLVERAKSEVLDTKFRWRAPGWVVYGRKPVDGQVQ
ncbi:S-adenosyl-L-methionine-dependent methyltransferase [Apiospora saccharicola]